MKIALTGDVMLGRLVDKRMVRNLSLAPETIWGDTVPLFRSADCRLINLECVISSRGQPWKPKMKAFHFRANRHAIGILHAARVNCATLANKHVLDFGPEALPDCLNLLDQAGIQHTGAGSHLEEALAPAFLDVPQGRIAVIALTDNEPEWEATESQPGVNYVDWDSEGLRSSYRKRIAGVIDHARRHASFVIISAHIGPTWGAPYRGMRTLAHQLLDLGGDCYWGHSNHTPQGIELYQGKVIVYSSGDFVDDYAVDPDERNDLSFLFNVEGQGGKVERLRLFPVRIENFQVHRATGSDVTWLQHSIQTKCRALHTDVSFQDGIGTLTVT
ncbi:MAG: putative polyglutamine synthesis accessory protein [Nitrospirales bacterium]|nr:MAG: putative polyglutamine synthesis accessory protein [Nitrospirales bacterium]